MARRHALLLYRLGKAINLLRRLGPAVAVRGARRAPSVTKAGPAVVFGVTPTKVFAFGKGTFSHTSFRF
jgi:hypothetical protein